MLTTLAIIFLAGLCMGGLFKKMKLPGLMGMIITGIIIGPYALDVMDENLLSIAGELRNFALVVILTRAGLSLDVTDLKKVGRPAVLMCFVPALVEMLGTIILAPILLDVTRLEAAIIGSVIAAVSPAVIVPRMIKLINEGYGREHSVPQLILAGASVDDVFVIVVFTAFTSLAKTGKMSAISFLNIPISIILGAILGIICGIGLQEFFRHFHMRHSVKVLILFSISFLMLEMQNRMTGDITVSGLIAIMVMGMTLKKRHEALAKMFETKYNKIWVAAEVILFVLVGAAVDVKFALKAGVAAIILVIGALLFRMVGVLICLIKTKLTKNERVFCMIAYTPKATVQAAIGSVPLAMGLACGNIVLTVAVLAILITAPFGAICIDSMYKKLLG